MFTPSDQTHTQSTSSARRIKNHTAPSLNFFFSFRLMWMFDSSPDPTGICTRMHTRVHAHRGCLSYSSQRNVLTTKRPRIALVDNTRETHAAHPSPPPPASRVCPAHRSSMNTDCSAIDLFFSPLPLALITPAFPRRASGSSHLRLYSFPKKHFALQR